MSYKDTEKEWRDRAHAKYPHEQADRAKRNHEFYKEYESQKQRNAKAGAGCFIATATYESPMAKEVVFFRQFRDEKLLPSHIGRSAVKLYYFVSPPFAKMIETIPILRIVVRKFLLNPVLKILVAIKNNSKETEIL